jgi:hypothetical protein
MPYYQEYDSEERHRDGGWDKWFVHERPLDPGAPDSDRLNKWKAHKAPPKPRPTLSGTPDEWFAKELRKFEAAARSDPSRATYDFMARAKKLVGHGLITEAQCAKFSTVITSPPRVRAEWARRSTASSGRGAAPSGGRAPKPQDERPWRQNMNPETRNCWGPAYDDPHNYLKGYNVAGGGAAGGASASGGANKPPKMAPTRGPRRDELFAEAVDESYARSTAPPARPASSSSAGGGPRIAAHNQQARPRSANAVNAGGWMGGTAGADAPAARPESAAPAATRQRPAGGQRSSRPSTGATGASEPAPFATGRLEHNNDWMCRRPGSTYEKWQTARA